MKQQCAVKVAMRLDMNESGNLQEVVSVQRRGADEQTVVQYTMEQAIWLWNRKTRREARMRALLLHNNRCETRLVVDNFGMVEDGCGS